MIAWDGAGIPSVNAASPFYINGLCTALSDPLTGGLRYVASGWILDSLGQPMPNAPNAQQVYLAAVPHPGDPDLSYVFHQGLVGDSLFVSEVDLSLNGGLGDVTSAPIYLGSDFTYLTTAFSHPAGHRHSFVARRINSPALFVWNIDAQTGLNVTPLTLPTASTNTLVPASPRAIKIAPSIDRIAFIDDDAHSLWIQDLDPANIQLGTAVRIAFSDPLWDLEFSSENHRLYVTDMDSEGGELFQLDVSILDSNLITATRDTIDPWPWNNAPGSELHLQLGPDGRIYGMFGSLLDTALLVIRSPDAPGTACDVVPFDLSLQGGQIWSPLFPWQFWPRSGASDIVSKEVYDVPRLSPNPLIGTGRLQLPLGEGISEIQWLDAAGRLVRADVILDSLGTCAVDPTGLPSGLYLLRAVGRKRSYAPVRAIVLQEK